MFGCLSDMAIEGGGILSEYDAHQLDKVELGELRAANEEAFVDLCHDAGYVSVVFD